ncbi:MAG: hypothetical protein GX638_12930 [Crenarchaeota archaeon]|nr:hypothetical protein [Thermoproteota archaeon]
MTALIILIIFTGTAIGIENGKEDCAINKYELECTLVQGEEYCKPVVKDWCINYKDGDYTYRKDM